MSEIDRLSNTGSYPMLPVSAKRRAKDGSRSPYNEEPAATAERSDRSAAAPAAPRPPKSIIDEFA